MKKFEVKGVSVNWATHSWTLPLTYIILTIIDFIGNDKLNYIMSASAMLWACIVFMNRVYTKKGLFKSNYSLEFGNTDLICKQNNSVIWYIPYSRLSHTAIEPADAYSWFNPKSSLTLIYTKDGDSYSIPVQIGDEQNREICAAIKNVIV